MRIVFLADDFPPQSFGGAGISTFELALGMKEAGHDVSVITTTRKPEERSEYQGLHIYKIATTYPPIWRAYLSIYNPVAIRRLEDLFREIKPEVVHINNIHFYLSYYSIKLSKKYAKVVVTLRDAMSFSFGKLVTKQYLESDNAHVSWLQSLEQSGKRWNPFRNMFIRYFLNLAHKRFAVSYALKKALGENGIGNVEVIHTGIDLTKYEPREKSQEGTTILFAGRLNEAKGAKVVDEAMTRIRKVLPQVKLAALGANGQWLNREEMIEAYMNADLVLVPSVCFDALPRVVLEASASGKPVISTPYGGAKEIIEDGQSGYIINPSNTDEFADKIVELLQDKEKASRFGKAGHKRVQKLFNQSEKIRAYEAVYKNLLEEHES